MSAFDQLVESFRRGGMSAEAARIAAIGRGHRTEAEARLAMDATEAQSGVTEIIEADRPVGTAYTAAIAAAQSRYRFTEADATDYVNRWVTDSLTRLVREAGGTIPTTESAAQRPAGRSVNVREVA